MKNEKINFEELKNELEKLLEILNNNVNNESRYAIPIVTSIINDLEEDKTTCEDNTNLVSEVSKRYRSLFNPKGGLSEFYIWNNDFSIRKMLNTNYETVVGNIDELLEREGKSV